MAVSFLPGLLIVAVLFQGRRLPPGSDDRAVPDGFRADAQRRRAELADVPGTAGFGRCRRAGRACRMGR